MRSGSGPASTTTTCPEPALSTSPSPCPTSQATSTQSSGGHPGVGTGTRTTIASRAPQPAPVRGRRSNAGSTHASSKQPADSSASAKGPVPQPIAAVGRSAPRSATAMIHAAHQEAPHPRTRPSGGSTSPTTPPNSPRMVAGPTAGAASRLAATATRLTWPEMAATTGVQAIWAAAGTAITSATGLGSQPAMASRHPGARNRIPAVASTDSTNPKEIASHGSTSSRMRTATPSARVPRRRPLEPIAMSPTEPIAAARSTLGSVRATTTKAAMPSAPTSSCHRPRTPHQRPTLSTKPATRVRFVPDTASRWVSPVARKSSATCGGSAPSSPSTRAGTSAWPSRGPARAASRIDSRMIADARQADPGRDSRTGSPLHRQHPGELVVLRIDSRPRTLRLLPRGTSTQSGSPRASTGTRLSCTNPRPLTRSVRARNTTYDELRPSRSTGSEATVSSTWTIADIAARSLTGLACTASVRRDAPAATPPPTSRQATAIPIGRPRAAAATPSSEHRHPLPGRSRPAPEDTEPPGHPPRLRPRAAASAGPPGPARTVVEGRHRLRS